MDHNQLPACQRCRRRKIKCDKSLPKCNGCAKAVVECTFVDPDTLEEYSRQALADLQNKEAELYASLNHHNSDPPQSNALNHAPRDYVGDASGVSFFETMFSTPQWSGFKARLVDELGQKPQIREPETRAAPFPSQDVAMRCIDTYLAESHLQRPFLLARDLHASFARIYPLVTTHEPTQQSSQDKFRLLMVCAIATVNLQRRGQLEQHPYSFFLAAQSYLQDTDLLNGLDAIQNLLLIARFGVYFHTGISVWEISRICISICIEMELHLPPLMPINPLDEQHRRRIFWECYLSDRYCSTTLGRPFAIADRDIQVQLPVILPDEQLLLVHPGQLDKALAQPATSPSAPTINDMTVFICNVRLRQITSRINDAFFSKNPTSIINGRSPPPGQHISATGQAYLKLSLLMKELDDWRQTAPVFIHVHSLYQREAWYDFMLEKERLSLIRGAMNLIQNKDGVPPKKLVQSCTQSASKVIQLYSDMFSKKQINVTRGYFQMLFSAGLSLIYCLSCGQADSQRVIHDEQPDQQLLAVCGQVLWTMSETMLDARPYACVFDLIQRRLSDPSPSQDTDNEQEVTHGQAIQQLNFNVELSLPHQTDLFSNNVGIPHDIGTQEFHDFPPEMLDMQSSQNWFMMDSDPWMAQLMAGMESDVNRFACDVFPNDTSLGWNVGATDMPPDDHMQPFRWR